MQGGPHNHTIAGIVVCLKQASTPEFQAYAQQVRFKCAEEMTWEGLRWQAFICKRLEPISWPLGFLMLLPHQGRCFDFPWRIDFIPYLKSMNSCAGCQELSSFGR